MPKNTREFVGEVGVDSGQVMIIDPCYIESEWKDEGKILSVDFWGGQGEELIAQLRKVYPSMDVIRIDRGEGRIPVKKSLSAATITQRINKIIPTLTTEGLMVSMRTTSSYDECCEATLSKAGAGQFLNGMAVASSTGVGDGVYPVYATYDDEGRVSSLEIVFDE